MAGQGSSKVIDRGASDAVFAALKQFADMLMPHEAEEPILGDSVRAAIFDWLAEIRARDELRQVGLKPRRSALLFGPPGCGKTTLAHHLAARLGLPLALVRSESLVTSALGGTGKNIGELFDAMKATEGKIVVFFDEIDAIGGRRMSDQGASVERAASLNVLLRRIERFNGIALAATNRQDFLDEALWRRFDMQVAVELPGPDERFAIIKRYAAPFEPSDDDIDLLVARTFGASPALLRGLMEGVKRAIVMAPRLRRELGDAPAVFRAVVASVAPPPGVGGGAMWSDDTAIDALRDFTWPMPRPEEPT